MAIHWNKIKNTRTKGGNYLGWVWATCPICNKGRWVTRSWAKYRVVHNGTCRPCAYANNLMRGAWKGGCRLGSDGYIARHYDTYSADEQTLLKTMFTQGYVSKRLGHAPYVKEHRAIMALHLNRPLSNRELVHHINGCKSDNRLSNLKLLAVKAHHKGHGDDYYQLWQEALLEIKSLTALLGPNTST